MIVVSILQTADKTKVSNERLRFRDLEREGVSETGMERVGGRERERGVRKDSCVDSVA